MSFLASLGSGPTARHEDRGQLPPINLLVVSAYQRSSDGSDHRSHGGVVHRQPVQTARPLQHDDDVLRGQALPQRRHRIHRDLKPGNVMMSRDGEPSLVDFGLAKRESGEITMTVDGATLGTPAYMSPEQASGKAHEADARSDV